MPTTFAQIPYRRASDRSYFYRGFGRSPVAILACFRQILIRRLAALRSACVCPSLVGPSQVGSKRRQPPFCHAFRVSAQADFIPTPQPPPRGGGADTEETDTRFEIAKPPPTHRNGGSSACGGRLADDFERGKAGRVGGVLMAGRLSAIVAGLTMFRRVVGL